MNSLKLYEISDEVLASLESGFDEETGAALPIFEEKRALWANKSQHVAAYILNMDATAKALAGAEAKIAARRKAAERRAIWLREYLTTNMARLGITKIDATDMSFSVRLYPDRDESVEIEDGAVFDMSLCNAPAPPTPSKALIKFAILAGEPVSGARIVRKDRLVIR